MDEEEEHRESREPAAREEAPQPQGQPDVQRVPLENAVRQPSAAALQRQRQLTTGALLWSSSKQRPL